MIYSVKCHERMVNILRIIIKLSWFNGMVRARKAGRRLRTIGCNTSEIRTGKRNVTPARALSLSNYQIH